MPANIHAAVDQFRNDLRALLDEAVQQHTEGLLKQAETGYRQVLLRQPQQPEALNNLGVLLAETDRLNEALMVLRQAVTFQPSNPDYLLNLGRVETVMGNGEAAQRSFRGALEQDPGNAEAALTLGSLLEQAGGLSDAEAVYRSLHARRPQDARALLALARVARGLGRPGEAERALQEAIAVAPETAEAHLELGRLLLSRGAVAGAVAALSDAIAVEPESPAAHLALGQALACQGEPTRAAEAFRRVLAQEPASVPARVGLVRALAAEGRVDAAVEESRSGAKEPPAELLIARGEAQAAGGHAEAAVQSYGAAIQTDPTRAAAYLNLGPLLRAAGRDAEADQLFEWRTLLYWRRLPGVEGYGSVSAYNAALARTLETRLQDGEAAGASGGLAARAPLRCGAEITPELFDAETAATRGPALEAFAGVVTHHLQAYLAERRGLPGNPYFSRPPSQVELRGQGLRLPPSAFVEAHAHPEAYLSGIYFLQVPPEVAERRDSIAGCLRFSDAPRPSDWTSFETIRPKAGLLVLFPSYLWQAAVPFNATGDCLALAFDLFAADPPEGADPPSRYAPG
jgi:tetratricopeptide (TPR) repeat protein